MRRTIPRLVLLIALTSVCTQPAWAAPTLESVQAQLAQAQVLRGTFQSVRTVSGLKNPLRSSGRFLLTRQQGLIWSQEQPFEQTFTVTAAFLRQQSPGRPPSTTQAADNPVAALVGKLLLAIFSGKPPDQSGDFAVAFTPGEGNAWAMTFTPQRPPVNGMFRSIRVAGARWIDDVTLLTPQGDRTVVTFQNLATTPVELSDAEQSAFRP